MKDGSKRFYAAATVVEAAGGFAVALDGRTIQTPARAAFVTESRAAAAAAAAEWAAQGEKLDAAAMPVTRMINTAIDQVRPQREAVIDEIARFGESDLLCYRAVEPVALVARQARAWEPLLDDLAHRCGVRLRVAEGVMPVRQDADALQRLRAVVAARSDAGLAALHVFTTVTGSVVIGLAVADAGLDAAEAFAIARIDESWQIEHWGEDSIAADARAARWRDMEGAARFHALISAPISAG